MSFSCFPPEPVCFSDPHPEDMEALAEWIAPRMRTPKQVKTMDRRGLVTMGAALALKPVFSCPPERRGLILSQPQIDGAYPALESTFSQETDTAIDYGAAYRRFPPLWLTWHLPNMSAAHLAAQFDCRGPVHSLNSDSATRRDVRELAATCFEADEADAILEVHMNPEPIKPLSACANLFLATRFSSTVASA